MPVATVHAVENVIRNERFGPRLTFATNWFGRARVSKSGHLGAAKEKDAGVAQLVEHVIRNDGVGGSSPFTGTILLNSEMNRMLC